MQPIASLGVALLQSGGGNAWGPLTALAVGIYGSAVVLCLVIGGGILSTAGFDPDNQTKGLNWVKRGFRGGAFGLLAIFSTSSSTACFSLSWKERFSGRPELVP